MCEHRTGKIASYLPRGDSARYGSHGPSAGRKHTPFYAGRAPSGQRSPPTAFNYRIRS